VEVTGLRLAGRGVVLQIIPLGGASERPRKSARSHRSPALSGAFKARVDCYLFCVHSMHRL
jgi:hypothetical protein